ncbi:quinone oxidoreductase [Rhodococcus aetherivorans]|uniref:Quinone oxidoreductase n=1 Tax=Rhodococcus aetherivorans TaxID=191292 RepID=N1MBY8_9NOCA|nr:MULTISPECIES: NADPH:quinone oxidoreductase family protein [Rhodococcus]ETT27407.1 NADPH:quinone reductase [Rhodococcus rhodochrous ATCC 21198]MDV6295368.1 NADPH:quinone oxidoreductase family protein [Rhodococcus aetherivorans]NGP28236.1 NADPH:quinone oxidoreductase family protein [Rhodococcus aetherivorans]OLL20043.1 NADPH:quinone oxidoreductase [Rhodococcus sp. M8]QPG43885.1 NADPH:quinone oxidoreductase family protein [Rhodococcus sp. M8]
MQAVQLTEATGPDGVRLVDLPEPDADGLVVVDLHAAGVSFPDLLQTTASYQVVRPLPSVLGVEGAGTVRTAPAGSGLSPGQRVAVLATGGAWQQTVAVDPKSVFPLPDSVSLTAGAGFLMNYLTVHFALDERARYRAGETVLVHGAAGGVGVAALQVAAALGLETIAVVSTEEKAAVAKANRATHTVAVEGFKDRVLELTGGRGVDIVLDPVGGDRFTDSLRSLAPNGRVVVLGFTGGEIPTVKVNRLLLKNISVLGAGWGEYVRTFPGYTAQQWAQLEPLLRSGALQIPEPTVHPMTHAAEALRSLAHRSATGKVALALRP